MAVGRQLRLLLMKNLLLRRRHPGLLVLEVVWPVLIVAIVAMIRIAVPPIERHTCHYQDRAMPSAGLVPFLQTFVCNLDNKCHSHQSRHTVQQSAASVSKLVQKVTPYLASEETLEMLNSVDNSVVLMNSLNNLVQDNPLMEQLDNATKLIRYFRDPAVLENALLSNYSFSQDAVRALMESRVNLTALMELSGYPDMKGVVCDPVRLADFLVFPNNTDVTTVSWTLCDLNDANIPNLTLFLQSQLNVPEIIRLLGLFESVKERLKIPDALGQSLNDVADMLDLVLSMGELQDTVSELSSIQRLPDLIRNLPLWANQLTTSTSTLKTMEDFVTKLDPVVSEYFPKDNTWTSIKDGFTFGSYISEMSLMLAKFSSNSSNVNGERFIESIGELLYKIKELFNDLPFETKRVLDTLSTVNWTQLWGVFSTVSENNQTELLTEVERLVWVLETISPSANIKSYFSITRDMMHSANLMLQHLHKVHGGLQKLVSGNREAQRAIQMLVQKGPTVTLTVMRAFSRTQTVTKLLADVPNFEGVCRGVMSDITDEVGEQTAAELRSTLCAGSLSQALDSVLKGFSLTDITKVLNATVVKISTSSWSQLKAGSGDLPSVIQEYQLLTHNLGLVMNTTGSWSQLFSVQKMLPTLGQDSSNDWLPVLAMMDGNYARSSILGMLSATGKLMTDSPSAQWVESNMRIYIHHAANVMKVTYTQMNAMTDVYAKDSFLGQLVYYGTNHAPQLVTAFTNLMVSGNLNMVETLFSSDNPIGTICQGLFLFDIGLPYDMAVHMRNLLCSSNWKHEIQQIMGTHTAFTSVIQGLINYTASNCSLESDWQDLLHYTSSMVDLMTAAQKSTTNSGNMGSTIQEMLRAMAMGPFSLMSYANFTQINKAMMTIANRMGSLSQNEVDSMISMTSKVMEKVEQKMIRNPNVSPSWSTFKRAIRIVDDVTVLLSEVNKQSMITSLSDILEYYPQKLRHMVHLAAGAYPEFIDAFKMILLKPHQLVETVVSLGLKAPDCHSVTVSRWLALSADSNFGRLEAAVCTANWTLISMQMSAVPKAQPFTVTMTDLVNQVSGQGHSVVVEWQEVVSHIQQMVEMMKNDIERLEQMHTPWNFLPFNMSAISTKWAQFYQDMKQLQNVDYVRLAEALEKLEGMKDMPWSNSELIRMLNANNYLNLNILQFINKQLNYFKSRKQVMILDMLGSDELRRVEDLVSYGPKINQVIANTLLRMIQQPSWEWLPGMDVATLCSNLTAFSQLVAVDNKVVNSSVLQQHLCSLNLNFTVVTNQLMQHWDGFSQLVAAFNRVVQPNTVLSSTGISEVIRTQLEYNNLLTSVLENPPQFYFIADMQGTVDAVYTEHWKKFEEEVLKMYEKYQDPEVMVSLLNNQLHSWARDPNMTSLLVVMNFALDTAQKYLINTSFIQPSFSAYPNLKKIHSVINQLPVLFEMIIYTSVHNPEQVLKWGSTITSLPVFCSSDPTTLFTEPSGSTLDIQDAFDHFCSINFTQLESEYNAYQGLDDLRSLESKDNASSSVNITSMAEKILTVLKGLQSMNKTSSSSVINDDLRFLNVSLWSAVFNRLGQNMSQTTQQFMRTDKLLRLYGYLTEQYPEVAQSTPFMQPAYSVLAVFLDKVLSYENMTSFSTLNLFTGTPEVQKVIQILEIPGVIEVLLESANTEKFAKLVTTQNTFSVLFMLCSPLSSLETYLTVPDGVSIDMNLLKRQLCGINLEQLQEEISTIIDINRLTAAMNGSVPTNYTTLGKQYNRLTAMVERWSESLPPYSMPAAWLNDSFWMNMLQQYGSKFQQPYSLIQEIDSLTSKLGTVMNDNPMRQVGLVAQTVLQVFNENLNALAHQNISLENLSQHFPILQDVLSALGVQGQVLESMMKAPVQSSRMLMEALLTDGITAQLSVCNITMLEHLLQLPASFNTTALYEAVCMKNSTQTVNRLIQNFDLEQLSLSLNSSAATIPNWSYIFEQSQELQNNVQRLVNNPPTFNVTNLVHMLNHTFNTSNLWQANSILSYSKLFEMLDRVPELQVLQGVVKSTQILADFLDDLVNRLVVEGITVDLASLFSSSPSFVRVMKATLNTQPDITTVLSTIQARPSKISELSFLGADGQLLPTLCTPGQFEAFFIVPSVANTSAIVNMLCSLDYKQLTQELKDNFVVDALTRKFGAAFNGNEPTDLQQFVLTMMNLTNQITSLTGAHNVTFDDVKLKHALNVNTTRLLNAWDFIASVMKSEQASNYAQALDSSLKTLGNSHYGQTIIYALKAVEVYLHGFNSALHNISSGPITLATLLNNTEVGNIVNPFLANSSSLQDLLDLKLLPLKLLALLKVREDVRDVLCGPQLLAVFAAPGNESGLLRELQASMCSSNMTVMMWQSIMAQATGHQLYQQISLLSRERGATESAVNITNINSQVQQLVSMVMKLATEYQNGSRSMSDLLDLRSFESVFSRFSSTLGQRLANRSQEWSVLLSSALLMSSSNDLTSTNVRVMKVYAIVLDIINDRLEDMINNNISLHTLLNYSDTLVHLMEAYIDVVKLTPKAWLDSQVNLDKLVEVSVNTTLLDQLCISQTLDSFLADKASVSTVTLALQTSLCSLTDLPQVFTQALNYKALHTQIADTLNTSIPVEMQYEQYVNAIVRYNQLITRLATAPLTVDSKVSGSLDFSALLKNLQDIMMKPKMIFRVLKAVGMAYNDSLMTNDRQNVFYGLNTYVTQPMLSVINQMDKAGVSLSSILHDPSKLLDALPVFMSFDLQFDVTALIYLQPLMNRFGNSEEFRHRYLCNGSRSQVLLQSTGLDVAVLNTICSLPTSQWISALQGFNLTETQIIALVQKVNKLYFDTHSCNNVFQVINGTVVSVSNVCHSFSADLFDKQGMHWLQFMTSLESVVHGLVPDKNQTEAAAVGESLGRMWDVLKDAFLNKSLPSVMKYMEVVDHSRQTSSGWAVFRMVMSFLQSAGSFLNSSLKKMTDPSGTVYLRNLLPDSQNVAAILENILGPESAAEIMTAAVNPQLFFELAYPGKLESTACNPAEFSALFVFPPGTNVTAIQQGLCEVSANGSTSIQQLLDLFKAGNMLLQLDHLLNSNNSGQERDPKLWQSLHSSLSSLLTSLEQLQSDHVNTSVEGNWLGPVVKQLSSLGQPSATNMESMCQSFMSLYGGSQPFQSEKPRILRLSQIINIVSKAAPYLTKMDDLTCSMVKDQGLGLGAGVDYLIQHGLADLLQSVTSMIVNATEDLQCKDLVTASIELSSWLSTLAQTSWPVDNQRLAHCLQSPSFALFLKDISRLYQVMEGMTSLLGEKDIGILMQNSKELTQILKFTLSLFVKENPAAIQIADLLTNSTAVELYLTHTVHLAPNLVNSLLTSVVRVPFMNGTVSEIAEVLCDPVQLGQMISLPESSLFNLSSFSQSVCSHDVSLIAAMLKDAQQSPHIINNLMTLLTPGAGNQFVSRLTTAMVDIFSESRSFTALAQVMSNGLDFKYLVENADTIDAILADGGSVGKIVDSLSSLVESLRYVVPPENHDIITSANTFLSGLVGLDLVKIRLMEAVKVSGLLKDTTAVKEYLTSELSLSPQAVMALLNSTYSIRMFLGKSNLSVSLQDDPCERKLQQIIVLNASRSLHQEITGKFCSMSTAQLTDFFELMVPQLDIGFLLHQYITSSADSFLTSVNMTQADLNGVFSSMGGGMQALEQTVVILMGNDSSLVPLLHPVHNPTEGEVAAVVSSQLLCGSEETLDDQFNLKAKLQGAQSEQDAEEEAQLNGEFCRDLYRSVKSLEMGSVIWSYVKPIMTGKILFTPDTLLTRKIIANANITFDTLSEVRRVAKLWSEKVTLVDLTDVPSKMGKLQNILSNSFVQGILKTSLGMDLSSLSQSLDTVSSNSVNTIDLQSLKMLAELLYNYTSCLDLHRFQAVADEEELTRTAFDLHKNKQFLAGIVFLNLEDDGKSQRKKREAGINTGNSSNLEIPPHIMYKIRMDMDNVPSTNRIKDRLWMPEAEDDFAKDLRYLRGFVQLQDMVESAILRVQAGDNYTAAGVLLQQMPFPCHREDDYIHVLGSYLLPILMIFAWLAAIGIATHNIVYDRQSGQEESLRIMGMISGLNFVAWLVVTMMLMTLVSIVLTTIFRFSGIFQYSNPLLIFFFLLAFCFSSTMMCYMISSFFSRATLAILTVIILFFVSFLPYGIFIATEIKINFWQKSLTSLCSTTAFSFGAMFVSRFEEETVGLQWSNASDSTGDSVSFSWLCFMMLIDGIIYLVIGWYVRNVKPGKYGVRQPWYFPVTASYWCSCLQQSVEHMPPPVNNAEHDLHEQPPEGLDVGISVRDLRKAYRRNTEVVHGVDMDIYSGQVTTLLGHNGAAKTSTLNMLVGVLNPTSGTVLVEGMKTYGQTGLLGICHQHNTLFEYMTVEEHMELYAGIKGHQSTVDRKKEIRKLLEDVDLLHMKDVLARNLSGGMKRRLCVALAFVGGSRTVVLDEPTSGVDPHARKNIWNLIIENRMSRTILMSTHHMDEADILSDRILIMHSGCLLSVGSPAFLKEQLGSGYKLTLNCNPVLDTVDEGMTSSANVTSNGMPSQHTKVLAYVQSNMPGARFVESVGADLTVSLPHCADNNAQLCHFFQQLDAQSVQQGVLSYGVSSSTLEEVFLKLTSEADSKNITASEDRRASVSTRSESITSDIDGILFCPSAEQPQRTVQGCALKLQQLGALLMKRIHHYRRNWCMMVATVLLPLLAFLAATGFSAMRPHQGDMHSLLLSPALYTQSAPQSFAFFKDHSSSEWSQHFIDTLMAASPGIGTTCMADYNPGSQFKCTNPGMMYNSSWKSQSCACKDFVFECEAGKEAEGVQQMMTRPDLILQDLGSKDIHHYLVHSFSNYINQRFGGWSIEPPLVSGNVSTPMTKVWFNNKGHHAVTSYLNALSNNLLRSAVSPEHAAQYGITLYNHPLMLNDEQLSEKAIESGISDVGVAMVILLAVSFITSSFMVYLTNEKVSQERDLQALSGVGTLLYWSASFLWDLFVYTCAVAIMIIIVVIFKSDGFYCRYNLGAFAVLLFLYGWAVIPLMYCTLRLFNSGSTAYLTLFCANMLMGLLTSVCVFVLTILKVAQDLASFTTVLKYVFLIFPQYSLTMGLVDLITNQFQYQLLRRFEEDTYVNPFSVDMLGWKLLMLAAQGFLFLALTFFIQSRKEHAISVTRSMKHNSFKEDEDVICEEERVRSGAAQYVLTVKDLCKVYQRGQNKFCAVNHLNFGVSKGECFGLLGVNGAGKTTTFKMLSGAMPASAGDAVIQDKPLSKLMSPLGNEMGYCPQEDALDMYLTGRETLLFHAKLRGFDAKQADSLVNRQVKQLQLESLQDSVVHTYSGGNKRKLALAVAMLGEPPLLLLDEPTTGMDAANRRLTWKCITKATQQGQSVLLTSHSMDECDVLCSRLAIMVNGELKCLGSPQHLKHKFGEGYTVALHLPGLSSNLASTVDNFISKFPQSALKDHHHNRVEISIPRGQSRVADIFAALLEAQAANQITYYSVSQTTLDSVFVSFALEQTDDGSLDSDLESCTDSTSCNSSSGGDSTLKDCDMYKSFTDSMHIYVKPDYTSNGDSAPMVTAFKNQDHDILPKLA